jgi:predicted  nucleic acid-binding Zn-ribbon protein
MTTHAPATQQPPATNGAPLATRSSTTEIEKQRAVAETIGAIQVARQFPRDTLGAIDRIIQACTRPVLAESALYSYARGGTEITGPSIRMAEAIAQNYGNIQFGVRELEQRHGESTVEAYAWDVETNTRSSKTFQVAHKRVTRERTYDLTDPRDIYELVANQGARRLRACILSVIPGDIIEHAITQVETTLRTRVKITPELLQSTLDMFKEVGVTKKMIETRIQRHFDAVTPAQLVQLGKYYNALKDGMGVVADYFQVEKPETPSTADSVKDALRDRKGAAAPDGGENVAEKASTDGAAPSAPVSVERKTELRNKIAEAWKSVKPAQRSVIVARFYGKQTILDLNETQLEELLEKLPEIIEGAQA